MSEEISVSDRRECSAFPSSLVFTALLPTNGVLGLNSLRSRILDTKKHDQVSSRVAMCFVAPSTLVDIKLYHGSKLIEQFGQRLQMCQLNTGMFFDLRIHRWPRNFGGFPVLLNYDVFIVRQVTAHQNSANFLKPRICLNF
ncbi:hypothetical protein Y032_0637g949 [Ancylostoma ceylanicum]|uniref:Uncharacterized protein n=1 Tax=Ancylostoma ceylanicum TaxID=53326 RepID=A0A016WJQ7_9BILA|nr:hypothetical protein Y032_0637g949 [Ancylostoma ceylanicum]